MAVLEILALIIGIAYGYLKPGKEDRMALLKKGLLIGIALAVIFVAIGFFAGALLLGGLAGIAILLEVIILAILFIIGTFIGDYLEVKIKK